MRRLLALMMAVLLVSCASAGTGGMKGPITWIQEQISEFYDDENLEGKVVLDRRIKYQAKNDDTEYLYSDAYLTNSSNKLLGWIIDMHLIEPQPFAKKNIKEFHYAKHGVLLQKKNIVVGKRSVVIRSNDENWEEKYYIICTRGICGNTVYEEFNKETEAENRYQFTVRVLFWAKTDDGEIIAGKFLTGKVYSSQWDAIDESKRIEKLSKKELFQEFRHQLEPEGVTSYRMINAFQADPDPVLDPTYDF